MLISRTIPTTIYKRAFVYLSEKMIEILNFAIAHAYFVPSDSFLSEPNNLSFVDLFSV